MFASIGRSGSDHLQRILPRNGNNLPTFVNWNMKEINQHKHGLNVVKRNGCAMQF